MKQFNILFCLLLNTILISAQQWNLVMSGDIPANYQFVSMSVVNENVVWVAANKINFSQPVEADHLIKILKTTDGGNTWSSFDVEEAMGRITWDIHAIDENIAWISSNKQEITDTRPLFKTTDGGDTWNVVELPNQAGGVYIHFFDQNNGLAIRNFRVATTTDGGDNWTPLPEADFPIDADEFFVIWSFNNINHNAYIGDHVWLGSSKGRVFHSTDRGYTWSVKQVAATNEVFSSMAFTDELHGVGLVPGTQTNSYPVTKVFETTDGGINWNEVVQSNGFTTNTINSVPGMLNTFFVGSSQAPGLLGYNLNGIDSESWVYDESLSDFFSDGIIFSDPETGYAAGYNGDIQENQILKWTGPLTSTWHPQPSGPDIVIFPNPAHDVLRFHLNDKTETILNWRLCDLTGKEIKSSNDGTHGIIPITEVPLGIYFLTVKTKDSEVTTKVIID